jgi:hypothetical protein
MMQIGDGEGASAPFTKSRSLTRACPTEECRQTRCADLKSADIEVLACLAARLAGQDPDRVTTIKLGQVVVFDDVAWRYPDFLARAEAAYRILASVDHPSVSAADEMGKQNH